MSGLQVPSNNGSVMHHISPIHSSHNIPLRTRNHSPEPDKPVSIKGPSFLHMFSILIAVLSFGFMIVFMTRGLVGKNGLMNSTSTVAKKLYLEKYALEVTPAEWTFYMAPLVYLWQCIWIMYGITTVCRRTDYGFMYRAFPVLPPILYVVFSFALACHVSWLLIWDKEYMEVALVFINLMTCNLYICLVVSLRRLNEFGMLMARHKLMKDIWLIRLLIHNGLAMFATWGTVAAMFNFAIVITYQTGAKLEAGGTVSLSIFTLEIIAWWIFDNFVFDKLLRYLFTPYFVLLVSIAGIISKNWNPDSSNSLFTAALFGFVIILTIIKIVLTVYRHVKYPLFSIRSRYRKPLVSFEVRSLLDT